MIPPKLDAPLSPAPKSSSFYWAMKLLPAPKREAMFAIYAFCREVDDIADGGASPTSKKDQLETYRRAVNALYNGEHPDVACVQHLNHVRGDFDIQRSDLIAVIDGMEMDAVETVVTPDMATFELYIDRVACAVGRLSNAVFGLTGPAADQLAHHLGNALQITNILRDIDEDQKLGRVYLPQDLLKSHGVTGPVIGHPNLEPALVELAAKAEHHFTEARLLTDAMDPKNSQPARLMHVVYEAVFKKIKRRGLGNTHISARLSKIQKFWVALRFLVFG